MIAREQLWTMERAKKSIEIKGHSNSHLYLRKHFIDKNFNENHVLLFRFSNFKHAYSICKICKIKRNDGNVDYILSVQKRALRETSISLPDDVKIEIIDKK